MTNNVIKVETANPHIIAEATGPHSREFPPRPDAKDSNPAIVVKEVIKIGTTRRRAAKTIACTLFIPPFFLEFAASINTIALFTEIPVSATMPYIVYRLNGFCVMIKPMTTPIKANGTVARIISG